MSPNDDQGSPGWRTLAGRLARTGLGAVQNRVELFAVECQEEKARLTELVAWCLVLLFFGMTAALLFTAVIIFLFPLEYRLYVAGAFALLYAAGAVFSYVTINRRLEHQAFSQSIEQVKKDGVWLESFK